MKSDEEFCWVLQETAKGVNEIESKDASEYWYNVVKGPDYYYKNLLTTMKELYGCGLEKGAEGCKRLLDRLQMGASNADIDIPIYFEFKNGKIIKYNTYQQ